MSAISGTPEIVQIDTLAYESGMTKILVIDDDLSVRTAARASLESAGHDVAVASGGLAGLNILQANWFFIIIVDLFMPEQDGIEVIRRIRSVNKTVKILAIAENSGRSEPDFLRMTEHLGANATLEKPFTSTQLLERILMLRNVIWHGEATKAPAKTQIGDRANSVVWRGRSRERNFRNQIPEQLRNVVWRGVLREQRSRGQTAGNRSNVIWRGRPRAERTIGFGPRSPSIQANLTDAYRARPTASSRPIGPQPTPFTFERPAPSRPGRPVADTRLPGRYPARTRPPAKRRAPRRLSPWDRLRRAVQHWRAFYARQLH